MLWGHRGIKVHGDIKMGTDIMQLDKLLQAIDIKGGAPFLRQIT